MGLFRFDNLPVNTLIGADRETFDAVVKGREIGDKYKCASDGYWDGSMQSTSAGTAR